MTHSECLRQKVINLPETKQQLRMRKEHNKNKKKRKKRRKKRKITVAYRDQNQNLTLKKRNRLTNLSSGEIDLHCGTNENIVATLLLGLQKVCGNPRHAKPKYSLS